MEKINEVLTPEVFQFSAAKTEVRSLVVENEPWLVAKDVCDILGLSDTNKALNGLDDDEKLTRKIFVSGQNRKMWVINESGLYALILRSNKPEAKIFRKWVTSEVLPAIRKKGHYGAQKKTVEFIDARDVPFQRKAFNGFGIRYIEVEDDMWFSVNDIQIAIGCRTSSYQAAKQLNMKQTLAVKIWLFGNTHPAWFTNNIGLTLLTNTSRTFMAAQQLKLNLGGKAS
jgi:prophage antirepressor-like protein